MLQLPRSHHWSLICRSHWGRGSVGRPGNCLHRSEKVKQVQVQRSIQISSLILSTFDLVCWASQEKIVENHAKFSACEHTVLNLGCNIRKKLLRLKKWKMLLVGACCLTVKIKCHMYHPCRKLLSHIFCLSGSMNRWEQGSEENRFFLRTNLSPQKSFIYSCTAQVYSKSLLKTVLHWPVSPSSVLGP